MSIKSRCFLLPAMAIAAMLLFVGAASRSEAQNRDNSRDSNAASEEAQQIKKLRDSGAKVDKHKETGKVRFIGTSEESAIDRPADLGANASAESAARAHLDEQGELFGIEDQAQELRVKKEKKAEKGRSVVRFEQVYRDVPVLGGELNVNLDDSNNLLAANGEVLPDLSLDVEPDVDAKEAREQALGKIAGDRKVKASDLEATEPELWIYDPSLLGGPGERVPKLVWRMDVAPDKEITDFKELVLVDAETGSVVLNFNQVPHALDRWTYSWTNGYDQLECADPNPCTTDTTVSADAVAAHEYTGNTYDFYSTNHGRDSLDNAGMTIVSNVDYPSPIAFWDGYQVWYPYGWAADDVVGHEYTHGVTDHESDLLYYGQSGAINESLSDVWGEFVDLTNSAGNDDPSVRWKLGEDITGELPYEGAGRDMKDPTLFEDPDRMQSPLYLYEYRGFDNGGVHHNSGVNNKAAYLLTDGDTFNGKTVTGLGIQKVAKIYYEAQTNLLTSASDYSDLHSTLQQACANLTGTGVTTAADCQEVKDAVDAAEMHLDPVYETSSPNVFSVSPAENATGVSRLLSNLSPPGVIEITFDERMRPDSLYINGNITLKNQKTGKEEEVWINPDLLGGKSVTLTPGERLAKKAVYEVRVEGAADTDGLAVKDLAGNPLAQDKVWTFKTGKK